MAWLKVIGDLMQPVLIPIATALVAWLVPSPHSIMVKKQLATHMAEESGKGLDQLP